MNRIIRTMAAALLAVVVTGTPAAGDPLKDVTYRWLTCPAGTSTTATIDRTGTQQYYEIFDYHFVELVGTIAPCRGPLQNEVFALAAYSGASAYGVIRSFPRELTPVRPYSSAIRVYPGARAVCVIANETTRLACVELSWTTVGGADYHSVVGPLPVDSPLVAMPATTQLVFPGGSPGGPTCIICPTP
ncbi:hypothetical protein ACFQZ4_27040 [Catellatospora coxensis]